MTGVLLLNYTSNVMWGLRYFGSVGRLVAGARVGETYLQRFLLQNEGVVAVERSRSSLLCEQRRDIKRALAASRLVQSPNHGISSNRAPFVWVFKVGGLFQPVGGQCFYLLWQRDIFARRARSTLKFTTWTEMTSSS
jgi:hypothetical protein